MTSGAGEKSKIGRQRRSRLRRAKWVLDTAAITDLSEKKPEEKPTEISLPFRGSSSSSSSSERSPENDVEEVLTERFDRDVPSEGIVSSHGVVSLIGRRREMEDAVRVELGFASGESFDFFGVYDGHGGAHVSGACRDRLHGVAKGRVESAARQGEGVVDWREVMAGSFAEMDEEVSGTADEAARTVGSTAVVAVVGRDVVVVANCGDSRAVMSRGGTAVALSVDHKPDRPDELKRIEAAGGRVINWNGHRILGVLATSRSIGDQYLKPFVSPEPEVTVTERTRADEFLIMASDGIWDVISSEYACQVVRRCLEGRIGRRHIQEVGEAKGPAETACLLLAQLAMARGSSDNISVIVVELNKRPWKFSQL